MKSFSEQLDDAEKLGDGWLLPENTPRCRVFANGVEVFNVTAINRSALIIDMYVTDLDGQYLIDGDAIMTTSMKCKTLEITPYD